MLEALLGKEITFYVKQHIALVIISMILAAVSSIFVVAPAALLQPFLDEGMKFSNDPVSLKMPWIAFESEAWSSWYKTELVLIKSITPNKLLMMLSFIIFISVLCKSVTIYFSELCATAFSNRAVLSLRIDLFKKLISLPMEFHDKNKSGELVSRAISDVGTLQRRIEHIIVGMVKYPVTIIACLTYLLITNFKLTLLVLIVGPILISVVRLIGKRLKKHATILQDITANLINAYHESLLCLKVIQGFCRRDDETNKFKNLAYNLYKRTLKINRWALAMTPTLDITVFFILPAVLIIGKIYYNYTIGELSAIAYAFSRLSGPAKKLSKVHNSIKVLQGATGRLFGIMNTPSTLQDKPYGIVLDRHKESIEFKNVSFGYSPVNLILKDLSFKVNAGEMVAFVGNTGAGKSTIMELIPRFYDVAGGSICIDGTDIRDVTLFSLRKQIGIVNQDTSLFHSSIADNIGYGSTEKDMDGIVSAAKIANAHEFILSQPNGYQSIIGDQGSLLSGGQRQRISIARAILIDPSILILDEAASALDAESEKLVQVAIENLQGTRTILVVAHRLSTILKANCIHVLENGRIIESGTINELLDLNGRFKQLYDMQFCA